MLIAFYIWPLVRFAQVHKTYALTFARGVTERNEDGIMKKEEAGTAKKPGRLSESLKKLADDGHTVKIVGAIKNGKLEIDPESLAELNRLHPQANLSFVAVNAPFRTH